jgi:hypothetical protein
MDRTRRRDWRKARRTMRWEPMTAPAIASAPKMEECSWRAAAGWTRTRISEDWESATRISPALLHPTQVTRLSLALVGQGVKRKERQPSPLLIWMERETCFRRAWVRGAIMWESYLVWEPGDFNRSLGGTFLFWRLPLRSSRGRVYKIYRPQPTCSMCLHTTSRPRLQGFLNSYAWETKYLQYTYSTEDKIS